MRPLTIYRGCFPNSKNAGFLPYCGISRNCTIHLVIANAIVLLLSSAGIKMGAASGFAQLGLGHFLEPSNHGRESGDVVDYRD